MFYLDEIISSKRPNQEFRLGSTKIGYSILSFMEKAIGCFIDPAHAERIPDWMRMAAV
jgi:urease accessory protein UreF